jgi:AcrR family transcriptional regulator
VTDVSAPPGTSPGVAAPADPIREQLLRAAAAVFARQGYAGTRIMDVVRESGLSTGAVYGRFASKNDLLREAVVTRSRNAPSLIDMADLDRVTDLITRDALRTEPLADAEALRLEAYVTARREPEVAEALGEANAAWREGMAPLVESARADGSLADDVDGEAALFLARILNLGMLVHRGSGVPGPDPEAWGAVVARVVASIGSDPDHPAAPRDASEEAQ